MTRTDVIAAALRDARERLGVSLRALAAQTGVSTSAVRRILDGANDTIDEARTDAVAAALGATVPVRPFGVQPTRRRRRGA